MADQPRRLLLLFYERALDHVMPGTAHVAFGEAVLFQQHLRILQHRRAAAQHEAVVFGVQSRQAERIEQAAGCDQVRDAAGSSICGTAAVLATEPVVRARPEQVTVAVATVVVFGTLATFLYPMLYRLNGDWKLLHASSSSFGLYVGLTVHEVAQVVSAAQLVGTEAANTAVVAKMVRLMMLPLFLVALSVFLIQAARRLPANGQAADSEKRKLAVPWFAFGFVAVVMLNRLASL